MKTAHFGTKCLDIREFDIPSLVCTGVQFLKSRLVCLFRRPSCYHKEFPRKIFTNTIAISRSSRGLISENRSR